MIKNALLKSQRRRRGSLNRILKRPAELDYWNIKLPIDQVEKVLSPSATYIPYSRKKNAGVVLNFGGFFTKFY